MKEKWMDIDGYIGHYRVSNLGRVESLPRFCFMGRHRPGIKRRVPGKIISTSKTTNGYVLVTLCRDGMSKNFLLSRLVASAFIANPRGEPEVNHKDLNKDNCQADNLEWCSHLENVRHAYRNGTVPVKRGPECTFSKLTREQILELRRAKTLGLPITPFAVEYGVSVSTACRAAAGTTYKNVSVEFGRNEKRMIQGLTPIL